MIKVGDKLYCYKTECGRSILTADSLYEIFSINTEHIMILCVFDDDNNKSFFTINQDENGLSYKNWFIELKEYRKNKLLEIEQNI